jgi:rSAM/selenodomain-associated transferase 2
MIKKTNLVEIVIDILRPILASAAKNPNKVPMLSVIFPTLNAQKTFASVLAHTSADADEIVVSDGGSTDETIRIVLDNNVRLALGCPGRGWQLARGAAWARGDWLLFVHADTQLPPNWKALVDFHIENYPKKAAYFKFGIDAKGFRPRAMELLSNARTYVFGLPYGDQGLLISRALYTEVGGYPDWPLFEDVAIVRALGRKRLRQLRAKVATCPDRFENKGYLVNLLRNMSYITRYFLGADPVKLAKAYQK